MNDKETGTPSRATARYFDLGEPAVVLEGTPGSWDGNGVHILSIVEANRDGFKYWGYYCGGAYYYSYGTGLARSNDLVHWEKYVTDERIGAPVVATDRHGYGARWPTAAVHEGRFYLFVTKDYDTDSRIVMYSSADGISFQYEQDVVPAIHGWRNQNPFLMRDPKDSAWCLYYYSGNDRDRYRIRMRRSATLHGLSTAPDVVVMADVRGEILAAPSVLPWKGTYYLLTETASDSRDDWSTRAWASDRADGGFAECANSPLPADVSACAFQFALDGGVYLTYSHQLSARPSWRWDLRMRKALDA